MSGRGRAFSLSWSRRHDPETKATRTNREATELIEKEKARADAAEKYQDLQTGGASWWRTVREVDKRNRESARIAAGNRRQATQPRRPEIERKYR